MQILFVHISKNVFIFIKLLDFFKKVGKIVISTQRVRVLNPNLKFFVSPIDLARQ